MQPQTPQQPNQENTTPSQPQVITPNNQLQPGISASPSEFSAVPTILPAQTNTPPLNEKGKRPLLIASVLVLLLATGGFAAFAFMKKDKVDNSDTYSNSSTNAGSTPSANCTPLAQTTLTKDSAIESYKKFADAVKNKDQDCADQLSSAEFIRRQKITFQAPDGNWITASPGPEPIYKDFQELTDSLDKSLFISYDYERAIFADGSSDINSRTNEQTKGITLSYPVDLSKIFEGESKSHIEISFILDEGKVKVDDLLVRPGSIPRD